MATPAQLLESKCAPAPARPRLLKAKEACYCYHRSDQHIEGHCVECDCKRYRPRPCTCGHPFTEHREKGSCKNGNCSCRHYRRDDSPEALLRMGVRAGQWRTQTEGQDLAFMRPEMPLLVRVYTCGLHHTMGARGGARRIATKTYRIDPKTGDKLPLKPRIDAKTGKEKPTPLFEHDIVAILNSYEPVPSTKRQHVYRVLNQLEDMGLAKRVGKPVKGERMLCFYAHPRPQKRATEPPRIVTKSDYDASVSDSQDSYLQVRLILPAKRSLVKIVKQAIREHLERMAEQHPEIVTKSDYDPLVEKVVEKALIVLKAGYEEELIVVKNSGTYKEEISSEIAASTVASEEEVPPETQACLPTERSNRRRQTPAGSSTPEPVPDEAPQTTTIDQVSEAMNSYATTDPQAVTLLRERVLAIAPDASDAEIVHGIHQKGKLAKGKANPVGFLLTAVPNLFRGPAPWRAALRSAQHRATEWESAQRAQGLELARYAVLDPDTDPAELELWLTAYPELRTETRKNGQGGTSHA